MAMQDEKEHLKPTLAKPEEDEKDPPKSTLARLEQYLIGVLYSFVERDASTKGFWIKVTVAMFLVTAGPAIAIYLFFLGREHGFFD